MNSPMTIAETLDAKTARIAELETENARLVSCLSETPKWVPVSERLPDDGVCVLVLDVDDGNDIGLAFLSDGAWQWEANLTMTDPPAHWMPLPEPSK